MRLTLHTDYALRTLIYLEVKTDRNNLASIRDIAIAYHVSENHLVKVVYGLGKAGFIKTLRGRAGGICLARPAKEISIGDIVRHTEEDIPLIACMNKERENGCLLLPGCRLKQVFHKAQEAFMAELDRLSLADIVTDNERFILQDRT